jgi:hypothetical protein
MSFWHT